MKYTYHINPAWLNRAISVVLVGAGGTGSELLDGLARMHSALKAVGHEYGLDVHVFDPDTVSPSNIVRQRFWPTDIGQYKSITAVQRYNMFLGMEWSAYPVKFDCSWLKNHVNCPDLLITCVDTARFRSQIGKTRVVNRGKELLWLDTGNGSQTGQVVLGHLGQLKRESVRLPNIYQFYPELATMVDDNRESCSAEEALIAQDFTVNRTVANTSLTLLWNLLRYGSIQYHGANVDVRRNITQAIPIDTQYWEFMGIDAGGTTVPKVA